MARHDDRSVQRHAQFTCGYDNSDANYDGDANRDSDSPPRWLYRQFGGAVPEIVNGFGSRSARWLLPFAQSTIDLGYKPFPAGIGLTYGRLGVTANGAPQGPGDSDGPWTNAQEVTADGGQLGRSNTAPAGWKNNNSVTCGGSLLSSHFTDYANQLNGFLTTGIAQGVSMYGLTIQNEPSQASCQFQSMTMNGTDYVNFLKVLGPIVRSAHPSAKIMVAENVEWTELWNPYVVQIAGDATALSFVDIYSAHGYSAGPVAPQRDRSSNPGHRVVWFRGLRWVNQRRDAARPEYLRRHDDCRCQRVPSFLVGDFKYQ